jgi:hemerythrin superfamily protein
MAATRPTFRAFIARSHFTRPLAVQSKINPVFNTRFQSSAPQQAVNKVNAATANMSSANAGTVSDAIKHDHAELKEYYHNILSAKDDDSKIRWQNQFTWELARHSIGEELVVYPAMEKHMGEEGKHLAQKDRDGHNKVRTVIDRSS